MFLCVYWWDYLLNTIFEVLIESISGQSYSDFYFDIMFRMKYLNIPTPLLLFDGYNVTDVTDQRL